MSNHDILSVALQKYYSSLKALESFGNNNSLFDDVSSLDSFFSEFRNITFVIQKAVGTEENKAIYKELCTKHLSSDELKWFANTRNKTTKESPFQLKKELVVDVYMPDGVYTLKDTRLVVDFDNSFGEILELIENVFLKKFKLPEIFFSSRIVFSENGAEIDFYPQIRSGLMKMNDFMEDLFLHFPCECSICLALKKRIDDLYRLVQCKEIKFSNDYIIL